MDFTPHTTPNKRYVDNKKVAEHSALVSTKTMPMSEKLVQMTMEEKHVYEEILRTTLAMFHKGYQFKETVVITEVSGTEFYTKRKIEVTKGWRVFFPQSEQIKEDPMLPIVLQGHEIDVVLTNKGGKTTPHQPYTVED